jgi:hypothetical protein
VICFHKPVVLVQQLLGSVSEMVDKARRAVGALQIRYQELDADSRVQQHHQQPSFYPRAATEEAGSAEQSSAPAVNVSVDLGRKADEFMAKALQQFTEDRVAEVRRKAGWYPKTSVASHTHHPSNKNA